MIKPDRVIALRSDRTVYQHGNLCGKVYSRAYVCVDVLQEARNLAAAWEAGANVPRFIEVTRVDDRWALVTEYVPGETLAQRMASGQNSDSGCLRTLVEAQLRVQSVRAERFGTYSGRKSPGRPWPNPCGTRCWNDWRGWRTASPSATATWGRTI